MFEVTYTEMGLLIWALIATVKWIGYKTDFLKVTEMLRIFVENPQARAELLASYERFRDSLVKN